MASTGTPGPRISLLYVDDEPVLLDITRRFLERSGEFTVTTALSAPEAIQLLSSQPYDAIVSDYQMPEMDGIAFLKHLRSNGDRTPFIIFTGKGREEVVIEAFNNGADFYLQKGGDPKTQFAELMHKVHHAVSRRQAEDALHAGEERYRHVVEDQTEFICRFLPDGTHVFVNDAYCRYFGLERETIIGSRFKPSIHPDDRALVRNTFVSITPEDSVKTIDQRIIMPDGSIRWQRWVDRAILDAQGSIKEYQSVGRDITERIQAELELQQKNQNLAILNEVALQLAQVSSRERIREVVLKKYMELPGVVAAWFCDYNPDDELLIVRQLEVSSKLLEKAIQILGKHPFEIHTEVSDETYRMLISQTVTIIPTLTDVSFGQIPPLIATGIQKVVGADRFIGITYLVNMDLFGTSVLAMREGEPDPSMDFLESFANIVAVSLHRQHAEESLRESEERFKTLFTQSAEPQLLFSPHGIVDCNAAFLELFKIQDKQEIIGHLPDDFAPEFQPDGTPSRVRGDEILQGVMEKGAVRYEWAHLKHDTERTPVLTEVVCTIIPIAGNPMIHASIRDITERKETESALVRKHEEIQGAYEQLTAQQEELTSNYYELARSEAALQRSEAALREKSVLLEALFNAIPDVIGVQDAHHGIIRYNDAGYALVGRSPREIEGKRCFELIGHDAPCEICATNEVYLTKKPARVEKYVPELDIWLDARSYPVLDENREITYIIEHLRDISHQRHADQALRESEARFRDLTDLLPQIVFETDANLHLTFVNRFGLQAAGYSPDDLARCVRITDLIKPDQHARIQDNIVRILRGEKINHEEYQIIRKDGSTLPIMIYASPIFRDGAFAGFRGIGIDMSDIRRAQSVLQEREAELTSIFHAAPVGIGMVVNRIITEVNDTLCQMTGYSREEMIGQSARIIYPTQEEYEYVGREKYRQIEERGTGTVETRWQKKDGSIINIILSSSPLDPSDLIKGVTFTALDITGKRQAEMALRESETFNRELVESLPDYIAVYGQGGEILFVNPALVSALKYPEEDLLGTSVISYVAPEYHNAALSSMVIRRETGKAPPYEIDLLSREGDRISVLVKGTRIQYHDTPAILLVLTNITERIELEKEMEYHEKELIHFSTSLATVNKKLNLLSSITRHDINNQLMALNGFLDLLEMEMPDSANREYFTRIMNASARISAMIQFTKAYETIGMSAPVWQDIRRSVDVVAKEAPLGEVVLKNDLPGGTEVFADPLIVKVFYNLMENAVRYGGKITTIRFSGMADGHNYIIVCEDDGVGVPADEKQNIFERGFGKNTGLGLFLAREILAITETRICECGEPGKGARFEISVPEGHYHLNQA